MSECCRYRFTSILSVIFLAALPARSFSQPTISWDAPILLSNALNENFPNAPGLSSDGLTMFHHGAVVPGTVDDFNLWQSTRASLESPWSSRTSLGSAINSTTGNELSPFISNNGLTLYFSSNRPDSTATPVDQRHNIYRATRSSVGSAWSVPVLVTEVNSLVLDGGPELSEDGLVMFFHSERAGGAGGRDLWVSNRNNTADPWGTPTEVVGLNSTSSDGSPSISNDGLFVFFESDRPGGNGGSDLWMSSRSSPSDSWESPFNLGSIVNTNANELNPHVWIQGDRIYLFFGVATTATNSQMWMAIGTVSIPEPGNLIPVLAGSICLAFWRARRSLFSVPKE